MSRIPTNPLHITVPHHEDSDYLIPAGLLTPSPVRRLPTRDSAEQWHCD